jgi:hypothetical protein
MLTNKTTAAEINKLMLEMGAKLDASVVLVEQTCSENEFKEYRRVVGKLMGEILLEVMNPLYEMNPELKPKELE